MNTKRIAGLVILVIGIAVIIFALYGMRRIENAKHSVQESKGFLPKNPIGGLVGHELDTKASQYDAPVMYCLIAGIILVVVGAGVAIVCRKK